MGCGSCGTGKPNGCKSNGGCSSGGCNRMNVHDWLLNLPFADPESQCKIVEVSFNQGSRKEYYRSMHLHYFEKGSLVTVEGVGGFDVGEVSLSGELVRWQLKKHRLPEDSVEIKRILRPSNAMDIEKRDESQLRQKDILVQSRGFIKQLKLQMKLADVDLQADGKKATFIYTADDRVDFRELLKVLASEFKLKVEMRQIGSRQEAGIVGGIGSCGRELCCSTWLTDFKSVNTQAARYQNLSINQTKLSGQCGRLKCCLNFELDTYLDALQHFPNHAETLETLQGRAYLAKKDIFRNLMWYTLPEGTKQYPLTLQRVQEILQMNKAGQKPDELHPVEVVSTKAREAEPEFVDLVGQFSLKGLEKAKRNREFNERANKDPFRQGNSGGQQRQGFGGQGQPAPANKGQRPPVPPGKRPEPNRPPNSQPPRQRDPNPPRPAPRPPHPNSGRPPQGKQGPPPPAKPS